MQQLGTPVSMTSAEHVVEPTIGNPMTQYMVQSEIVSRPDTYFQNRSVVATRDFAIVLYIHLVKARQAANPFVK